VKLRVKLFGALAQYAGAREIDVNVPDGSCGADLITIVAERYPRTTDLLLRASIAVNQDVVPSSIPLRETDEIALLPPASGGVDVTVKLSEEISVDEAIASVSSPSAGGVAVFIGRVRNHSDAGDVERLEYSAYDEMAEKTLLEIAVEASDKWGLSGVAVRHAVGTMPVGSPTVVVVCAAAHRDEAFDACRYVVDELKLRAPIWKKEIGSWGSRWIGA
jgi:molybdopterin synthase catalytic subunit